MRQSVATLLKRAQIFYEHHERAIAVSAMVVGFIVDNLTLRRIDFLVENLVLISYLVIAGVSIFYINLHQSRGYESGVLKWLRFLSPIAIQFAFGGLFSAFFVFYWRSASFGTSALFLVFLFLMMVGNEIFAKHFVKLTFQISVFFVALLSFFIFYVPVVVGKMSFWVFMLSAIVSIVTISIFIYFISKANPRGVKDDKHILGRSIISILSVIIACYILNIIPPIPLAMKEGVVAYDVSRAGDGDYNIVVEDRGWLYSPFSKTKIYIAENRPVYVFSSVFAPTRLDTKIVHEWQVKEGGKWKTITRTTFVIVGGSDRGYRGYSLKQNVYEGKWRVNIETERGQIIGRVPFNIISGKRPNNLTEKTY